MESSLPTTIIAVDDSGSTGYISEYWEAVERIAIPAIVSHPDATILLWDDAVLKVDEKGLRDRIVALEGRGGTSPSTVVQYLLSESILSIDYLLIITDGVIDPSEIPTLKIGVEAIKIASVDVHCIGDESHMNLTIAAPFVRSSKCRLYRNEVLMREVDTSRLPEEMEMACDPDYAIRHGREVIESARIAGLGTGDSEIQSKLELVGKKLLEKATAQKIDRQKFYDLYAKKDHEGAFAYLDREVGLNWQTLGASQSFSQSATNYVSSTQDYGYIGPSPKLALASTSSCSSTTPPEVYFKETKHKFECPVLFDTDTPILLIANGPPVISTALPHQKFPLRSRKDVMMISRVVARIDHAFGSTALAAMVKPGITLLSPLTRREIVDCIPLDPSQIKAREAAITRLFFGDGPIAGSYVMWEALLYCIIRDNIPYLVQNTGIMSMLAKSLSERMRTDEVPMMLYKSEHLPSITGPMEIALWYCLMTKHLPGVLSPHVDTLNILLNLTSLAKPQ
jgi:hypothetical protein